jgi:hypothetical protein
MWEDKQNLKQWEKIIIKMKFEEQNMSVKLEQQRLNFLKCQETGKVKNNNILQVFIL